MEDDNGDTEEYQDWPHGLDKVQEIGKEIMKKWEAENPHSPRDYPSTKWLTENGYSHLPWILNEKHNLTPVEFFVLLTSAGGEDGYDWNIEDVSTCERLKAYLEDQADCRRWDQSTMRTNRSRINQMIARFREKYGSDALIALANDPSVKTDVYESFKEVVKELREDLNSEQSSYQYVRALHRFITWLKRADRIAYDPIEGIEDEFRWDWSSEPTCPSDEQVRRLWKAAESPEERMLVVGYFFWGLRTNELAPIHLNQFDFGVYPKIVFDERKNGPGEVIISYGLDEVINLLHIRSLDPDWNGHQYPSNEEGREYLCAKTMRRKLKKLAKRADVMIDGEPVKPKHGRTFYYNVKAAADTDLLGMAERIAKEQGATDPATVRDHYLTDETRQRYRRFFFRQRINRILPADGSEDINTTNTSNSSLNDFS